MAVGIGGISVGVGMDAVQFFNSLKTIDERLTKFQRDMKNIRLDAAFKGDPFSETINYMNRAKVELGNVFKEWRKDIGYVSDSAFSKLARRSKIGTDSMISDFNKVSKKLKELRGVYEQINQVARIAGTKAGQATMYGETKITDSGTGKKYKQIYLTEQGDKVKATLTSLAQMGGTAGPIAAKALGMLGSGEAVAPKQIAKMMAAMRKELSVGGKKVIEEYEKFGQKLKKEMDIQDKLMYRERLAQAVDPVRINKERAKTIQELTIAKARLRKEEEMGYLTTKGKARLMSILQQQQELGIRLTKKETIELKKYKAAQNNQGGIFSKEWLKYRAGWFIQLRLYWEAYRVIGESIRSVVDYQVQLSRAMRTARPEIIKSTDVIKEYGRAMRESIGKHAADWKDVGEVLYQLGSAGLSAEESMAGLNSTMSLIVGTEGDVRETTKAVAGIYNNFKDTLDKTWTSEEKLTYITDLAAAAWKRHQVEISELTDGYRRASAMAKVAGVSIEDLTALLSVANDHMIKGGQAGRALTNVWSRMSRTPRVFARTFGVSMDTNKPLDFMGTMGQLSDKFKKGQMSVAELGASFERLGLRGAPLFATFLKNWEDVIDAQKDYMEVSGEAADIEKTRLDNADGQWRRFVANLKSYAAEADGILDHLTIAFKFYADILQKVNQIQNVEVLVGNLYNTGGSVKDKVKTLTSSDIKRIRDERNRLTEKLNRGDFADDQELTREIVDKLIKYNTILVAARDKIKKDMAGKGDSETTKKDTKTLIGLEERKFYWEYKGTEARKERLAYLEEELKKQKQLVEDNIKDMNTQEKGSINRENTAKEGQELLKQQKNIEKQIADIHKEERKNLQEKLRLISQMYDKRLDEQNRLVEMAKIENKSKGEVLKMESESLHIRLDHVDARLKEHQILSKTDQNLKSIAHLESERRDINLEILKNLEAQKRRTSILYDYNKKLKEQAVEFHDLMTGSLMTLTTGSAKGVGGIMTDITGGFQDQKQEIINLRGELSELSKEYDEALTEGDVERANQIANEMQRLRENIEDLEDPVQNLKESFRTFFKDLVDQIRQTINEWIAMQILMGIVGAAVGGATGGTGTEGVGPTATESGGAAFESYAVAGATGGVFPEMLSFRTFSRGGMTNRPTLALLGDNPSKREIVIPEENIKSDHVSGYTRDREEDKPVNIINLISKEDVALAMASAEGERVIINLIGKFMNSRGKSINTVM